MSWIKEYKQWKAEEPELTPKTFLIDCKLYQIMARLGHVLVVHQWKYSAPVHGFGGEPVGMYFKKCTWCGHTKTVTSEQYYKAVK